MYDYKESILNSAVAFSKNIFFKDRFSRISIFNFNFGKYARIGVITEKNKSKVQILLFILSPKLNYISLRFMIQEIKNRKLV